MRDPADDDGQRGDPGHDVPRARVKQGFRVSPIWLVPIAAAAIVAYVGIHALFEHGPVVTITFETGEGLNAHQTELRHKAVTLGAVEDVSLSKDMSHVVVKVRVDASAAHILTDHAKFWVVRPRFSVTDLQRLASGLETIVSGAYIAVDPGPPGGKRSRRFTGLEDPPGIRSDEPGHTYSLIAETLGSVGVGSPVYYRDVDVGEVLARNAGDGRGPVTLRVFVRAPFDALVGADTRFWNSSGVSLTTGAKGLHLELQSLRSLLSGGIAFENPPRGRHAVEHEARSDVFTLHPSKEEAEADFFERVPCVAYFDASIAGLAPGADVQLQGAPFGIVTERRLVIDGRRHALARVAFDLQPGRVFGSLSAADARDRVRELLDAGLHTSIQSTNIVTGEKALSLEYREGKSAPVLMEGSAFVVQGEGGGMQHLTRSLDEVAAKLNRIPFDRIGSNLDRTLRSVAQTVDGPKLQRALSELSETLAQVRALAADADAGLGPALARVPAIAEQVESAVAKVKDAFGASGYGRDSDVQRGLSRLLRQATDAARNVRELSGYLDDHPEALLRGRSAGGTR